MSRLFVAPIIGQSAASGAQVIDGSLKFDSDNDNHLTRTLSSNGSTAATFSFWFKKGNQGAGNDPVGYESFVDAYISSATYTRLYLNGSKLAMVHRVSDNQNNLLTNAVFRDIGWYHVVGTSDSNGHPAVYVNGVQITSYSSSDFSNTQSSNAATTSGATVEIATQNGRTDRNFDGLISNFYFIDGQALDPENFGFTDGLTNTWKPKKYTGTFGTNGFYLPLDGNSLIGQDKSGNGNDWTPVNFGGSNSIEKATGALPILNTDGGGNVARVGVRTDSDASSLVLALPLVGIKSDFSNQINSGSTTKTITANGNAAASSDQSNFYSGSFEFDGTGDYLNTSNNSDFSFGSGDFTVEAYAYWNSLSSNGAVVGVWQSTDNRRSFLIEHSGSGNLSGLLSSDGAAGGSLKQCDALGALVANKWHHVAFTRSGNNIRLFLDGNLKATTDVTGFSVYDNTNDDLTVGAFKNDGSADPIDGYIQDVRIYKGVAKYTSNFVVPSRSPDILPDTPSGVAGGSKLTKITDGAVSFDGSSGTSLTVSSAGSMIGTNDFTVEFFIYSDSTADTRVFSLGQNNGTGSFVIMKDSDGIRVNWESSGASGGDLNVVKSGWHHVAAVRSSNNLKVYIDGKLDKDYGTVSVDFNASTLYIGDDSSVGSSELTGIISNLRVVQSALYTSNFTPPSAPLTNVTNTELLCCQSSTSTTAAAVTPGSIAVSGNATATNFNPFITDINTVRGQETGYATLNPLAKANISLSDGNLALTHSGSNGNWQLVLSTIGMSSGKFYCEFLCQDADSVIGIAKGNHVIANDKYVGQDPGGYSYNGQNGQKINNSSGSSYGSSYTAGDLIGIAFDGDNGTLRFYKNNVDQGQAFSSLNEEYFFAFSIRDTGHTHTVNFGQKPFKFPPPDGFQPLNSATVRPETVITRPDQYVGVTTYSGTGTTAQSITGLNFGTNPDFVWIKERTSTGWHQLFDVVRGANKPIASNSTNSEYSKTELFESFDYNGFTVDYNGTDTSLVTNRSSNDYVAWCWKAGGNKNTFNVDDVGYASAAAAGLDGGSINPSGASVGTEQGFSIIKFASGSSGVKTLSHGLLETPTFALVKTTGATSDWSVYHKDIGGVNNYLVLNADTANATATEIWGSSLWTSSVFGIKSGTTCATDQDVIAYLWHDVPGLQKFGVYEGNNNSDGPFVELGFRPSIIWTKNADSDASWLVYDGTRDTFNPITKALVQNATSGGNANDGLVGSYPVDFLSNGFKIRNTTGEINSAHTFIYCAWAEAPSVDLYGGGANSR